MTAQFAAREGDDLLHTSLFADIFAVVAEVAVYAAAGACVAAAAAAAGPLLAGAGIAAAASSAGAALLGGGCLLSGLAAGLAINIAGLGDNISNACQDFANWLSPPSVQGKIITGSHNVHINSKPAARAAGVVLSASDSAQLPPTPPVDGVLDYTASLLSAGKTLLAELYHPTVDQPKNPSAPKPLDKIQCDKHSPEQFLAEGSATVSINDQPAVRSNDRTTCEATVSEAVSKNVTIGGEPVVVREINSGKLPGLDLAMTALMLLRGKPSKIVKNLPCMLAGGALGVLTNRLGQAINATFNPIHAATGAKVLSDENEIDFVLPARFPLVWQRIYNSRNHEQGLLGQGWQTAFDSRVILEKDSSNHPQCCFYDDSGRQIRFAWPEPGIIKFSAAESIIFASGEEGQLLIADRDGSAWRLYLPHPNQPQHLRLSSISDEYGNGLMLFYDTQDRLYQLQDTAVSFTVSLHYHNPAHPRRVTRITERLSDKSDSTLVNYHYDTAGNLHQVIDATQICTREFGYTAQGLMSWHRFAGGLCCNYQWAYYDDWRVVDYSTSEGEQCTLDYDLEQGLTTVTHHDGITHCHQWNDQFLPTAYTDEAGETWRYNWNDDDLLTASVDPLGNRWYYRYDPAGNLIEEEDPLGGVRLTEWLPERALPTRITEPDGHCSLYGYNEHHALTSVVNALGQVQRFILDDHGQQIQFIDENGGVSHFSYNQRGQLTESRDCSGQPTRLTYDHRGRWVEETDATGERITYTHDEAGRLTAISRANGALEQLHWNKHGQLIGYETAGGIVTHYQYNSVGRLQDTINTKGHRIQRRYDHRGRLIRLHNENGQSYQFVWGSNNRLLEEHGLDDLITRYQFDACDRPVSKTFAANTAEPLTHYAKYDALGQLTQRSTPDGKTDYQCDPAGRLLTATFTPEDGQPSQCVSFRYNQEGHLIQEMGENGTLNYQHDALGNLTNVLLPDGRALRSLYYGSGHLLQISLDKLLITEFSRDVLHREISRTQGHYGSQQQYDRLGRLSRRERYSLAQPALKQDQTHWQYDLQHNLTRAQQESGSFDYRHYHYDSLGQLTGLESNRFSSEQYDYDPAANLLNEGQQICQHNRLTAYRGIRYRYDIYGRLIEKKTQGNCWTYRYDSEHRMTTAILQPSQPREPLQTVTFYYDPLGRRIRKESHYQRQPIMTESEFFANYKPSLTTFLWQGLRLLSETRNGKPLLYIYEDQHSYCPLARVDGLAKPKIYYYQCQPNGLPEQLLDASGELYWQGTCNSWGQTQYETGEAYPYECQQNLRLQGQYLDRETGLHYNLFRYYSPDIGRFITQDPLGLAGGLNLYQYAPNPLSWTDPWGLACIPNKVAGTAREKRAQAIFERRYGKNNVLSERYLRGANGKSVKDPLTGERRRIDFVVKGQDGKWRPVEITSRTGALSKGPQIAKEGRIREAGGIFVKNKNTGELIQLDDVSIVIGVK